MEKGPAASDLETSRKLLEAIPHACLLLADGRGFPVLAFNRAYLQLTPDISQPQPGTSLVQTCHWAKGLRLADKIRQFKSAKDASPLSFEINPAGTQHYWQVTLSFWPEKIAGRALILLNIQDQTKHHKLLEQCERYQAELQSAQLFKALVENSSDFIGIADLNGVPLYVNPAGRRMVGLMSDDDISKTKIKDYYPQSEHALVEQDILPTVQEKGYWQGETHFRHIHTDQVIPVSDEHFVIRDPEQHQIIGLGTITRDISELTATRQRLELERERLDAAQSVAGIGSWELDLCKDQLSWSAEAYRIFRIDPNEFEASYEAFIARVHPEDRDMVDEAYADAVANHRPYEIEHRLILDDGSIRYVHEQCQTFYADDGTALRSIGTVQDITERKKTDVAMRQAGTVMQAANDAIIMTDANGVVISVNPAFTEITGYTAQDVEGENPRVWSSGMHEASFYQNMWSNIQEKGYWRGEIWNKRKNGETYPAWENITAVRDAHGEITHYVSIFSDISAIKDAESRLEYMAHHDALTGLPNRSLFSSNLDQAIAYARRHRKLAAVLLLDLDRFKLINDTMGHATGDEILVEVAKRLKHAGRAEDTVARLGGDEFALVINDLEAPEDAAQVAKKIIHLMARPIALNDKKLVTSTSIGIGLYPNDGQTGPDLVRAADTAMYRSKNRGRNTFNFYTADLSAQAAEHLAMENELRRAISNNELALQYQPLWDVISRRVVGVEALLRWHHPKRGLIMPDSFIRIAEESGLIEQIGEWVLNSALDQVLAWSEQGILIGRMAINLSGRQVLYEHVADTVENALRNHQGLPDGSSLELEITENVLLSSERSTEVFERLKACGANIAIDDFGTGYSSLSRLQHLPVDTLKIDRSFLSGVPEAKENAAICSAIIAMGKNLGLRVLAEGVENEDQLSFLREHGCDEAQGFYLSRPLDVQDVTNLIDQQNRYQLF